jgi:anti-sigma-K factor RskA
MSEHERFEDAAGAYVLGALPDEERAAYAAHLASCATCQAEVEDLRMAVEALPASAPPMKPPPALKARIMAEVEREAALLASATEPRQEVKRPRWRLRWPTGAVAALACAALLVGLGVGALVFGGGGGETFRFEPDPSLPQASAKLEMTHAGATIVADNLPAPPSGKTYMVWLVRKGEKAPQPTSALFTPRRDGSATASVAGDMDGVDAVLVNTEPLGGSDEPSSPVLLTATLS